MSKEKEFNVLVAGVGGQGNILAAYIIAQAALLEGTKVRVGETFGMSQKGGAVVSHVRIGSEIFSPLVPSRRGDLVIGLEPIETLRVASEYSASDSSIFFNSVPTLPVSVSTGKCQYPKLEDIVTVLKQLAGKVQSLDASSLVRKTRQPKTLNMVMLGFSVGSGIFPISTSNFSRAIKAVVVPKWVDANLKAFELGKKAFPVNAS